MMDVTNHLFPFLTDRSVLHFEALVVGRSSSLYITNKLSVAPPATAAVWLSFTQAGYSNTKLLTVVGLVVLGFFNFFFFLKSVDV